MIEKPQSSQAHEFLFVAGCQRSGTTALADLLNTDPRIVVGRERYKFVAHEISPDHFEPDRFFAPVRQETNHVQYNRELRQKYDPKAVRYLGDKVPRYAFALGRLAKTFPGCKILFIMRDLVAVASSFNVRAADPKDGWPAENDYTMAMTSWAKALEKLDEFSRTKYRDQVFVVRYEELFSGDVDCLQGLYDFLELELVDEVRDDFVEATKDWAKRNSKPPMLDDLAMDYLEKNRDRKLEERCLALTRAKR